MNHDLESPRPDSDRDYLSPGEFARRHGLSRSSVYAAIGRGDIRSVRLGGRRLIRADELDRYAAETADVDQ